MFEKFKFTYIKDIMKLLVMSDLGVHSTRWFHYYMQIEPDWTETLLQQMLWIIQTLSE